MGEKKSREEKGLGPFEWQEHVNMSYGCERLQRVHNLIKVHHQIERYLVIQGFRYRVGKKLLSIPLLFYSIEYR